MYESPFPPWDFTDRNSFAFETVVKRWPVILTGIIDNIYCQNHELGISQESRTPEEAKVVEARIEEGKKIISKVGEIKYDMARDRPLVQIPNDGEPLDEVYNKELESLPPREKERGSPSPGSILSKSDSSRGAHSLTIGDIQHRCYLYRLVRSFFVQTTYWKDYDPFLSQKQDTFQKSSKAIYQLATTMHELEREKDALASSRDELKVIFKEMIQMCLWGNATDLSMLTQMSHEDIQHLQSVGRDAQATRAQYILHDDQESVWTHLTGLTEKADSRIDFVLDNAGFELFTDLVFADFLVTYTPYVHKVVFHPKIIPWFVSDVTPPDFKATTGSLLDPAFFPQDAASAEEKAHLHAMVGRWAQYIADGTFALSVPLENALGRADPMADFWTSPYPYWNMAALAPELLGRLKDSGLVIFKGDLNFRKLTGDVQWPVSTPFSEAIGPLAGTFPILSLRTNKADVVCAVDQAVAEKLDSTGEKWRYNGKYALVLFEPRKDKA
ncbi:uncharacterized protein BXZ73DRAFT_104145 [Epithele typhae]|uniref:uncharacterized protein n=1 Tax=Epithele typhae TaxID=378194 RepID=UPI002007530A|nr:uncharacterized protein BXZ73DRAFT_104145 [Epithele typhae]KAH9922327.1 hypothetical protein BXZ73DRAFT_104145 [Epithele typhae]